MSDKETNKYESIMQELGVRCKPDGTPTCPNPPTDEEFDEFETQLGYSLPADYRNFLCYYGGCTTTTHATYDVWRDGTREPESLWIIHGDLKARASWYRWLVQDYGTDGAAAEWYPGLNLLRTLDDSEEIYWPPELLPIATDGADMEICLALFGLRPGAIFLWRDDPWPDCQNVYLVADSFDEFMHMLYKAD